MREEGGVEMFMPFCARCTVKEKEEEEYGRNSYVVLLG